MSQPTLVKPGTKVKLKDYDPDYHGEYKKNDPEVEEKLLEDLAAMKELQERLYAEGRQALLMVLQAMDAGGKDGTIKHVMSGLNPQGCQVTGFKAPNSVEMAHDYLWRIHQRVPRHGRIDVFNRSHYEDVLVVRVHNLVPEDVWRARYEQINAFEKLLFDSGTRIVKFFLYISREEQRERFQARIDDPKKHWKFSAADLAEREHWDAYMKAFEEALSRCSTEYAPWHIIPANRKWYRNMVVADIVANTLADMDPQWPESEVDVSSIVVK